MPWTMRARRRRGARVQHRQIAGLLAHSSSQGEDRARHGGREMAIERPMSTWFFQPKAQHTPGLLAGFEHLAAGGLAEMFEIFRGAGIGRENFQHRTGSERLQRPPRFQHRQWTQQAGRVEGGIHCDVPSLTHISTPGSHIQLKPYQIRTITSNPLIPKPSSTRRSFSQAAGLYCCVIIIYVMI
jgi:hypothetical protein